MATAEAPGEEPGKTARKPGRPRDVERDRAILESTLRILQTEGYAGLTIEGVAVDAGVGRPTIYRRWPSKPALAVAALMTSNRLALPAPDTGSLRDDLVAVQLRQIELISSPQGRRITAGLVADLVADPELADLYVNEYLVPRRANVWEVLQRGVDRGELAPDTDFAFVYDLLMGPLFMRAVVWGRPLEPDAAARTVDVVLAAYGTERSTGKG